KTQRPAPIRHQQQALGRPAFLDNAAKRRGRGGGIARRQEENPNGKLFRAPSLCDDQVIGRLLSRAWPRRLSHVGQRVGSCAVQTLLQQREGETGHIVRVRRQRLRIELALVLLFGQLVVDLLIDGIFRRGRRGQRVDRVRLLRPVLQPGQAVRLL